MTAVIILTVVLLQSKVLGLMLLLTLAATVVVWDLGFVPYPYNWVLQGVVKTAVGCPTLEGCGEGYVDIGSTYTDYVQVDTNAQAREPFVALAILLGLVACVILVILVPKLTSFGTKVNRCSRCGAYYEEGKHPQSACDFYLSKKAKP